MLKPSTRPLLLLLILLASAAHAEPLSEVAFFNRCYTQLTGHRPSLTHPSRAAVKAGSLTGLKACQGLLAKATFGANHKIADPNDRDAVDVLNHMNDFHRGWFSSDSLEGAVVDTNDALRRDKMMHDETEAALHITRALFDPAVKYSDVVTEPSAMEALRTSGPVKEKTWDGTTGWDISRSHFTGSYGKANPIKFVKFASPDFTLDAGNNIIQPFVVMDAPLVQFGELLGVSLMSSNAEKSALSSYSAAAAPITSSPSYRGFSHLIQVHKSLGAGFAGTKSYIMLNLGRPGGTYSDGGLDMPRRWAKAVLSEALCREIPALRDTDATVYVQGNSKLPFRNSRQCMQCHASIDPLGAIARNVSIRPAPYYDYSQWGSSIQLAVHPVELKQIGATEMDADYYRRPPDGSLLYRSYNGDKVFVPITGTTDAASAFTKLGDALSKTNDLYVCAASRYYQMLTGIKVNLQDPGDKSSLSLNLQDLRLRNEVIALGLSLKSHNSLPQLLNEIMSSATYRNAAPAGDGK